MVGAACGTDKVGSSWSRPLRGIDVVLWCGGRLNGKERCKASPCLPTIVESSQLVWIDFLTKDRGI